MDSKLTGQRLQQLLEALELSAEGLAKKIKYDPHSVRMMLEGTWGIGGAESERIAAATGVRPRWLTHGNGPMFADAQWLAIPVLTQPCIDTSLVPLGSIHADSRWHDDFDARFQSLVEAIRERAPTGTARIYNLQYQPMEYHGHHYLRGTADAYAVPTVRLPASSPPATRATRTIVPRRRPE